MSPSPHRTDARPAALRAMAQMAATAGMSIRDERLRRRWSLATLAGRAGISPAHLAQLEAGKPASLETYARVMVALDRRPDLLAVDPRQRSGGHRVEEDFVHAAMGELEARHLATLGVRVALDEPYQHYQFAGRADVVAWDLGERALLHLENRTRFPNVQDALGSYASKRAYLGRVIADRLGANLRWRSETHLVVAAWSGEVLHVLRRRAATFRAACPDTLEAFEAWWRGDVASLGGATSALLLLDPVAAGRQRRFIGLDGLDARPRHRDYAELAGRLRRAE